MRLIALAPAAALIGSLLGCNAAANKPEALEPLNVLLITADDLNYDSVGAYGCAVSEITPNLDRLAQEGMLFAHAYVNISVCQPSRQSIMTGRYPHRNGAPGFQPIDRDVPTLQEELRKAGYLNAILGKERHLKPAEKFPWDYCAGEKELSSGLGIGRSPDLYYRHASEFFSRAREENKPFFLMANSHDPHRPFAGSDEEREAWGEDLPEFSRRIAPDEVAVPAFLADLPEVRLEVAEYYTSVFRCDQTVGAVLRALDESGFRDSTIVMFLSDNGMSVPFAKANCYLNSNKTPWIVRWPGRVPEGTVDGEHFLSGIDFMPTILEALHLPQVPGMDGESFLPVLKGERQEKRSVVFTQFHEIFAGHEYPMRCVQEGGYGYIVNFWADGSQRIRGDALSGRTYAAMVAAASSDAVVAGRVELFELRVSEELYDFRSDPDGLVNRIDDPGLQDTRQRLKSLLHGEMKRSEDPLVVEFRDRFME
jgi:N-sulfoglucosamine sulfohydrolase